MYPEFVIGFDCREMWLASNPRAKDEPYSNLLKFEIEKLFSINRLNWPSVFISHPMKMNDQWIGTAPGYTKEIPPKYRTSEGFWESLDAMLAFLKDNRAEYSETS